MSRLWLWLKCWHRSECAAMSLKCSRKCVCCSVSKKKHTTPFRQQSDGQAGRFKMPPCKRSWPQQPGVGLGPHDPLCCNGLQNNKAQCNWFHSQLHDVWSGVSESVDRVVVIPAKYGEWVAHGVQQFMDSFQGLKDHLQVPKMRLTVLYCLLLFELMVNFLRSFIYIWYFSVRGNILNNIEV